MEINILLFSDFETLDIFGPIEILARHETHHLNYYSLHGGNIRSAQNTVIMTEAIENFKENGVLVLPGGRGTRTLIEDEAFLLKLKNIAEKSAYCLSICTGSGLFAKAGILDGKRATSNKKAFDWAMSCSEKVNWIRTARWIVDGNCYTSSGVSAGMDMALGFMSDRYGRETALQIADSIEYIWNEDSTDDPFSMK